MGDFANIADKIWVFMAVLARMSGLFLIAPFLAHYSIPRVVKMCLAVLVSLVFFPIVASRAPSAPDGMWECVIMLVQELAVGLIIGFVGMLYFSAAKVAGELVSMQMGLRFATIALPGGDPRLAVLGALNYTVALVILLVMNGHHWFFQAILHSYRTVPIGEFVWTSLRSEKLLALFGNVFAVGFKLAAPAMAVLMLATVGIVVLARMVPQMNVFIVGLPVRIGVGLAMVGTTFPLLLYVFSKLFIQMRRDILFMANG